MTPPAVNLRKKQTNNIVLITFWSQFSVYALNTVLILFLTRPILMNGLGYSQAEAYAFIGVAQAMGYLMPLLGGFMADGVVGIRRAILIGSILLACAYLLVMSSGFTISALGDTLFIAAYALIPVTNSLLMGTSSSLVSHIYSDDAAKAKSAMTYYYMAINVGALLATVIAPSLLDSRYGPLSVLAVAFFGKSIAALNFAKQYALYDNVIWGKDCTPMRRLQVGQLAFYIGSIYLLTLFAYTHVYVASTLIGIGCSGGILAFLIRTLNLQGMVRVKQLIAVGLIIEAIVFFIIYNQTNSTLVLFASFNTDLKFLWFTMSPAQYQMLNPLLILIIGAQLPRFYQRFHGFSIPYQFASGTILSGIALLMMAFAATRAVDGIVNGNYLALTYILITIAELWVSAIGLSMIGLYCDSKTMAFAMGAWYLGSSMSNVISGRIAALVALPNTVQNATESLPIYQSYYFNIGMVALILGSLMLGVSHVLIKTMKRRGITLA